MTPGGEPHGHPERDAGSAAPAPLGLPEQGNDVCERLDRATRLAVKRLGLMVAEQLV